jgi:VanZ family protein
LENTRCRPGWRWVAVALYAGLLFWLSSLHHPEVPHFRFSDKLMHLGFYAGFGAVVSWAFHSAGRRWSVRKTAAVAALAALLYGATDEFHQLFVYGRTADVMDLLSDVFGGGLGGLFYSFITNIGRTRRKRKA